MSIVLALTLVFCALSAVMVILTCMELAATRWHLAQAAMWRANPVEARKGDSEPPRTVRFTGWYGQFLPHR